MIGEHSSITRAGTHRVGVRLRVLCDGDQRLPQRPAAASYPGRVVDAERSAERITTRTRQQRPPDHHVARGITHAGAAEVESPRTGGRARRAGWWPRTSPWNHTGGPCHVAARHASHAAVASAPSIRSPRAAIALRLCSSYVASGAPRQKLCCPGSGPPVGSTRCSARRNCAERGAELGQDRRCGRRWRRRRRASGTRTTRRVVAAGHAARERRRDRQRQVRRELPQPPVLLVDLQRVRLRTRQPHRHLAAEPEGPVVPPVDVDRRDRKIGPLRELRGDQLPRQ